MRVAMEQDKNIPSILQYRRGQHSTIFLDIGDKPVQQSNLLQGNRGGSCLLPSRFTMKTNG
jgi:hypothetical protein